MLYNLYLLFSYFKVFSIRLLLRCYLYFRPSNSLQCINNFDFVLVTFVYFLHLRSWTDYLNTIFEAFTELAGSSDFQTYRPTILHSLRKVINRLLRALHIYTYLILFQYNFVEFH
jgi:hypothetical protein